VGEGQQDNDRAAAATIHKAFVGNRVAPQHTPPCDSEKGDCIVATV
jgi:hypothetical protein